MDSFVDQAGLTGTRPNVLNAAFTKPPPGEPTLLSCDDVTTMFHEFGHALHGLLSKVSYPPLTGTNVPRDFVEFPSQCNEHWTLHPTGLRQLREALSDRRGDPGELVKKIGQRASSTRASPRLSTWGPPSSTWRGAR